MSIAVLSVAAIAVASGLIQGITGMGAGMTMMLVLPLFFPVQVSSAISGAICFFLTAAMAFRYRKKINYKMAILPALLFMAVSGTVIHFSVGWDSAVIKKILGVFLIILALYFLLIQPRAKVKPGLLLSIVFIAVSGLCDGLFSVGSPLMVLYFLSRTDDKEEYLGTIQLMFFLTLICNTALRISHHILQAEHIPIILAGAVGIETGLTIANRIVNRVNDRMFRNLVYVAIALSGLNNLLS
jgi:hypothetical protein